MGLIGNIWRSDVHCSCMQANDATALSFMDTYPLQGKAIPCCTLGPMGKYFQFLLIEGWCHLRDVVCFHGHS